MLVDIATQLSKIILILLIFIGTVGNILNLFLFTRPVLLKSSCTLYLIAASIDNLLVICTSLLTRLLSTGFSIDIASFSDVTCRLRYYFGYVFFALSPYFFILACFDRYCLSSASVSRRSWSNHKIAKRCIIGAIVLACLLYSHMAFFFELQPIRDKFSCYSRPGIYNLFYRIFYLLVYCLLPSFAMGVLCIQTLMNLRRQSRSIRSILVNGNRSLHRRLNRQLIRMLFSQVLTQLLCTLPFAILNLLGMLINTDGDLFAFFEQIWILPLFVSYTTSFYVFTMSSRLYRQELIKLLKCWKVSQLRVVIKCQSTGTPIGSVRSWHAASINVIWSVSQMDSRLFSLSRILFA